MIRVLIEKEIPTKEVECSNCGSFLRYGNADLNKKYPENTMTTQYLYKQPYFAFRCPVCGIEVMANWINREDIKNKAAE